jgi:serine/threonine-protein kinase
MSSDKQDGQSWTGRKLGAYLIEEQIGRGGMGVVYRAEQPGLGRKVALKLIAPQLAQEPAFRDRFRRESRLAAAIDHPNIIPVYEAEIAGNDLLYIAMRYVEGTDLREIIQREGRLDVRRAASIVAQTASALDAAHARDLVHRDVKPANVLIAGAPPHEHAYLTDFGLTKHIASDSALTETGQWVGTLDFVAPEQIMGEAVDGRADVYSLGCVLYEALVGQPPYPRDADVAKIYAHLNEPPPRVTDHLPELSPEFDAVIARALAKRRDDRYATAGEMGEAVRALLSPRQRQPPAVASAGGPGSQQGATTGPRRDTRPYPPTAAPPPGAVPPAAVLPPPSSTRRARWAALAAALLALGAAVGIAAANGVFGGSDSKTNRAASPVATTTTPKNQTRPKVKTVTVPAPTNPGGPAPTTAAQLQPFDTGTDTGKPLPATFCKVNAGVLYCWTPNDGYTISFGPQDVAYTRLRADDGANKGYAPRSGYGTLAYGQPVSGHGFTCVSQTEALTCSNAAGHAWRLPRYIGTAVNIR